MLRLPCCAKYWMLFRIFENKFNLPKCLAVETVVSDGFFRCFYGVLAAISFALSPMYYRLGSKGISVLEANSIRAILSLPIAYIFYAAFTGNILPNMSMNYLF